MNPVLVDPRELESPNSLPEGILPARASVSLNFLFVGSNIDDGPGLFVFNYEPKTYNSWYPPFHFRAWPLDVPPSRFIDLKQALDTRPPETRLKAHLPVAVAAIREEFNLPELNVSPEAARRELWLKFSKSQKLWTFYEFVYLWAATVPISALDAGHPQAMTGWIPLTGSEFDEMLATGHWKGLPLVDNLANLLHEPEFVDVLRDRSS